MSRIDNPSQSGQSQQGSGLADTASQVGQNIRDMGNQVRDMASTGYQQLRDQASSYYEEGRQRAADWEQGVESYIQEKPLQSVMIAAGVGVLLGLLWKR